MHTESWCVNLFGKVQLEDIEGDGKIMNATNNMETDWLTGVMVAEGFITTTFFYVSTVNAHCTS
jgi:hypothetical protein